MSKLNFFTVDSAYVDFLQRAEIDVRGFSRIPNLSYSEKHKPKFLCGVVLQINNASYYVPVSSFKEKRADNFLIRARNNKVVGSLRFNYMFPIPESLVAVRRIDIEPDPAYRALIAQELRYCKKNETLILTLAEKTYRKVRNRTDPHLCRNSCDFTLLEQKCAEYIPLKDRISLAQSEATQTLSPLDPSQHNKDEPELT